MRLHRFVVGGIGVIAGVLCKSAAIAEPFSATFSLTSDYRFRGISQNDRNFTPQAEADWNGPDGWSAGIFFSKVNFNDDAGTSLEIDLFGDKHWQLDDASITATAYYYSYPDHELHPGAFRYSTLEGELQYVRTWDSFSLTGTLAASPEYFGNHGVAWYAAIGSSYAILSSLTASATIGRQSVHTWDRTGGDGFPYTHWDAGLSYTYADLTLDARYVGTSLSAAECLRTSGGANWCGAGVIATASYAIGNDR